jgi:hypothetical protein
MTPDQQVEEVAKVKRFTNFIVLNPDTISPDCTIRHLLNKLIPESGKEIFSLIIVGHP